MADMNQLLKQAQKMQEQMQKAQEELGRVEVTGESGAGLVKITINGKHEVRKVELDPSLMTEDRGLIEDLIAAAMNAAVKKVADNNRSSLASMTSGLNLPEGFKLPF
ncbi:MAG: YbaB/EbfC family nucleoid-associated protein [Pseudomonadota bacterium]